MMLFEIKESYNLVKLREQCREEIKNQFPPVEDECSYEYGEFLKDESDLLFAQRLKEIAQQIEDRIYGKQKQEIQMVYKK